MAQSDSICILGLGNLLLGDEGFGVHFVRRLAQQYLFPDTVQVVDGGTLGCRLLDTVCSCGCLIVIDVIKIDDAPGSVYRFTREEMERRMPPPTSAHEVEFPDVLSMAELLDQAPEVVFLCIVPRSCGAMDPGMSPEITLRFPQMERLLLGELAALGVRPVRKDEQA
jgi:hydrogenase maturation protease